MKRGPVTAEEIFGKLPTSKIDFAGKRWFTQFIVGQFNDNYMSLSLSADVLGSLDFSEAHRFYPSELIKSLSYCEFYVYSTVTDVTVEYRLRRVSDDAIIVSFQHTPSSTGGYVYRIEITNFDPSKLPQAPDDGVYWEVEVVSASGTADSSYDITTITLLIEMGFE